MDALLLYLVLRICVNGTSPTWEHVCVIHHRPSEHCAAAVCCTCPMWRWSSTRRACTTMSPRPSPPSHTPSQAHSYCSHAMSTCSISFGGSCVLSHQAIVAAMMHHNRSAAVQEAAIGAVVALSCESAASRVQAAVPRTRCHDAHTVTIHTDAAWQYPWVRMKETCSVSCVAWGRPASRPTTGPLLSAAKLIHACVVHHR